MGKKEIVKKIKPILRDQGVLKTAIFGSFAKNKSNKNSDVDLIVEFKKNATLLDIVRLQRMLKKAIGRKVDVVTYGGLNPSLRKIILKQQEIIYEK